MISSLQFSLKNNIANIETINQTQLIVNKTNIFLLTAIFYCIEYNDVLCYIDIYAENRQCNLLKVIFLRTIYKEIHQICYFYFL